MWASAGVSLSACCMPSWCKIINEFWCKQKWPSIPNKQKGLGLWHLRALTLRLHGSPYCTSHKTNIKKKYQKYQKRVSHANNVCLTLRLCCRQQSRPDWLQPKEASVLLPGSKPRHSFLPQLPWFDFKPDGQHNLKGVMYIKTIKTTGRGSETDENLRTKVLLPPRPFIHKKLPKARL